MSSANVRYIVAAAAGFCTRLLGSPIELFQAP